MFASALLGEREKWSWPSYQVILPRQNIDRRQLGLRAALGIDSILACAFPYLLELKNLDPGKIEIIKIRIYNININLFFRTRVEKSRPHEGCKPGPFAK